MQQALLSALVAQTESIAVASASLATATTIISTDPGLDDQEEERDSNTKAAYTALMGDAAAAEAAEGPFLDQALSLFQATLAALQVEKGHCCLKHTYHSWQQHTQDPIETRCKRLRGAACIAGTTGASQ